MVAEVEFAIVCSCPGQGVERWFRYFHGQALLMQRPSKDCSLMNYTQTYANSA